MASIISQKIGSRQAVSIVIGKQLLDVITSGMYSDPRMAIREYLQNAVDSIDSAREQGFYKDSKHYVKIHVDGRDRIITVEDNGLGISGSEVDRKLGSLGCSTKNGIEQRGFRGIGRLGGLAYCDILQFETRRNACEPVYVVEWNGQALRDQISHTKNQEQIGEAVRRIASIETRRADSATDPNHFFRVRMINVHQFHSDLLMSVKSLQEYLSQTAPVDYKNDLFPFASQIKRHLGKIPGYYSYNIYLNGNLVVRPYNVEIIAREGKSDIIKDVELVECVSRKGNPICRGWFAQTSFLSALPPHVTMRGLRIRQGNIAVGDEYFLKDRYTESRFATWHIGELHISPVLRLNARRDGFEESSEYEDFLEWALLLCRRLSGLCRQSSKFRSMQQSETMLLRGLERLFSMRFFIDEDHVKSFIEDAEGELIRVRHFLPKVGKERRRMVDDFANQLDRIKKHPVLLDRMLDGRTLRGKK